MEEKDYNCPGGDTTPMQQDNSATSAVGDGEAGDEEGVRIEGRMGKHPVFLKCDLCAVVLTSVHGFTSHMKRQHKDSELERNKPFPCDLCSQGFYFLSSLNSHRSKSHHEVVWPPFYFSSANALFC